MPITRSELVYFAAGVAVGAAARSTFPVLKEKFGPLVAGTLAGAGAAFSESYAEVVKRVAEKVETVQDAMAEMKHEAADAGKPDPAASA